MKTVVGIFRTRQEATRGANLLQTVGVEGRNMILLCPEASERDGQAAVPTQDAMWTCSAMRTSWVNTKCVRIPLA